jgi:hypothetical protein
MSIAPVSDLLLVVKSFPDPFNSQIPRVRIFKKTNALQKTNNF